MALERRVHVLSRERRVYTSRSGIRVVSVGVRPPRIVGPSGGGGAPTAFEHVQATPATTWVINHNLGFFPDIHVYTVGGAEIVAEVLHISPNQAMVYLAAPMVGRARCV